MSYKIINDLISVEDLHKKYPLSSELKNQIDNDILDIKNILSGKDSRKILIVGPCSAWPSKAVVEYAKLLLPFKKKYENKIKFIMRVYIQKPRTTVGWVGPVNQPNPYLEPDLNLGFEYCRKMMIDIINMGYAIADESLYTHKKGYFTDLYSWLAIGARSTEDQEHRIFASMLDVPVGMKNPTSGDIKIGINSVIASQYNHTFAFQGKQISTSGNPYSHIILRGGNGKSNLNLDSLNYTKDLLNQNTVKNPAILIDLSHDNSIDEKTGKKDPLLQPNILLSVLDKMKKDKDLYQTIKGFMIESFIKDGNQSLNKYSSTNELEYGKSVTDGCIGIEKTIETIELLVKELSEYKS
jgi:3-deoxy-7-phosphoheptulonate synthase